MLRSMTRMRLLPPFRCSSLCAMSWMGPVPLAFDFAFPIASEDFDREQIFSFYVGVNC